VKKKQKFYNKLGRKKKEKSKSKPKAKNSLKREREEEDLRNKTLTFDLLSSIWI